VKCFCSARNAIPYI
jgi:hypothetical protein